MYFYTGRVKGNSFLRNFCLKLGLRCSMLFRSVNMSSVIASTKIRMLDSILGLFTLLDLCTLLRIVKKEGLYAYAMRRSIT